MATPGFAPPRQPRAAGSTIRSTGASPNARPTGAPPRRPARAVSVTNTRTSRNGCTSGKGFERRRRYVPSTDGTVTDCDRNETPRVSSHARPNLDGRAVRHQRDCRARDYRRGLSPYTTTSPTRRSASFSNRPARARLPVTPTPTTSTPTTPTTAPTENHRPPAPEDGWRE